MNYCLITTDSKEEAYDIFLKRINERKWPLYERTSHIKEFMEKDNLVFYIAKNGKNSKSLVASASVNKVEKLNDVVGDPDNKFKMLSYYLHLENIRIFKKPIGIKELVNDLEFIKNKKNYGLDMLTGVVKISQNDFNYIIKNDYK